MPTPFDPAPLTVEQQKQVDDRALAVEAIFLADEHIQDIEAQLKVLMNAWYSASGPAQNPMAFDAIAIRNSIAAQYYKNHDLLNDLITYRGALVGWKIGLGQPNHPAMPQFKNG